MYVDIKMGDGMKSETRIVEQKLTEEKERLLKRLYIIDQRLKELGPEYYIVIKKIRNSQYYYMVLNEDSHFNNLALIMDNNGFRPDSKCKEVLLYQIHRISLAENTVGVSSNI